MSTAPEHLLVTTHQVIHSLAAHFWVVSLGLRPSIPTLARCLCFASSRVSSLVSANIASIRRRPLWQRRSLSSEITNSTQRSRANPSAMPSFRRTAQQAQTLPRLLLLEPDRAAGSEVSFTPSQACAKAAFTSASKDTSGRARCGLQGG